MGKTNNELIDILIYSKDIDTINQAWEKLLNQSPDNEDLTYIIKYYKNIDIINQACEILLKQSPDNYDLTSIIEYCKNVNIVNQAIKKLRTNLKIKTRLQEKSLIKKIAKTVIDNPERLDMDRWHCGTSHCIAGWACVLDKTAKELEINHGTKIAATAVIPNYAKYFNINNNEALKILKKINNLK